MLKTFVINGNGDDFFNREEFFIMRILDGLCLNLSVAWKKLSK
jgi:hypothetical protein